MAQIDLYTLPHKALRAAINHAATLLSATGPERLDDDLRVVVDVIDELRAHAAHEEAFIHPLLARFAANVEATGSAQHVELDATAAELERSINRIAVTGDPAPGQLVALYRAFQRFNAHNLLHLDFEETVAMPALWATTPAGALDELIARFRATHPEAAQLYHRWPHALTTEERALLGVA